MNRVNFPLFLLLLLWGSFAFARAMTAEQATAFRYQGRKGTLLQRPAFCLWTGRGWTWYALFPRIAAWNPQAVELPVAAVKVYVYDEGGNARVNAKSG